MSISHTVTGWFLRYLTKRLSPIRERIQYILGAIRQTSGTIRKSGSESRIRFWSWRSLRSPSALAINADMARYRCVRFLRMISSSSAARHLVTSLPSTWSRIRSSWSAQRRSDSARASPVLCFCHPENLLLEQEMEPSVSLVACKAALSELSKSLYLSLIVIFICFGSLFVYFCFICDKSDNISVTIHLLYHHYNNKRLTALCPGQLGSAGTRTVRNINPLHLIVLKFLTSTYPSLPGLPWFTGTSWFRGSAVEHWSSTGELSLSCAQRVTTYVLNRPL